MSKVEKTDDEWRSELSPEQFRVCREKGTEAPFTGEYWQCDGKKGLYLCRCCGEALFDAETKYDSGSGWPSFMKSLSDSSVSEVADNSHGMQRTEVKCARCDAHLGHVFPDGPGPNGMRYCINSASINFKEE